MALTFALGNSNLVSLAAANDCSWPDRLSGTCGAPSNHGGDAKGDGVDLWANEGGGAQSPGGGNGSNPGSNGSGNNETGGDDNRGTGPQLPEVGCADGLACEVDLPPEAPEDVPPPVFISDLANFRASAPTVSMEPSGWMVVGLDANFFVSASEHVLSGDLLGRSAEVRFIPSAYTWFYGDGQSATTATRGSSWSQLGVKEFEPTETSHIYRSRGAYSVQVEVSYAAEYQFAGYGWQSINGAVTSASAPLNARAIEAKTVLVERDCRVARNGPGC